MLVGAQLAPQKDFCHYDRLIDLGVDHLSFCLEFVDPEWFAKICPARRRCWASRSSSIRSTYCAKRMPKGAVSGEIIAGVEPVEATLRGIDWIAAHGAFPTVCIFRPTVGSDMEDVAVADVRRHARVMAHVYEACRRNWIPIGAAPNIEVSIVVNPDDAALLAPRTPGSTPTRRTAGCVRALARPLFSRRMRPRPRRDSGANRRDPASRRPRRRRACGRKRLIFGRSGRSRRRVASRLRDSQAFVGVAGGSVYADGGPHASGSTAAPASLPQARARLPGFHRPMIDREKVLAVLRKRFPAPRPSSSPRRQRHRRARRRVGRRDRARAGVRLPLLGPVRRDLLPGRAGAAGRPVPGVPAARRPAD